MVTNSEQRPMQGRTVLVTGGTGGIGYQTARLLARDGAPSLLSSLDGLLRVRSMEAQLVGLTPQVGDQHPRG